MESDSPKVPPPLPAQAKPIRYVRFEGELMGLHTAAHDRNRLEIAQKRAQEWMVQNPGVEIVSVDSAFGHYIAIVTVWFR